MSPATSEASSMEGAARAALAEVEARWRRDQFAAAQERNRLRAEIKELKEQQQQQQQSVPSGVDHSSPRHQLPSDRSALRSGPMKRWYRPRKD